MGVIKWSSKHFLSSGFSPSTFVHVFYFPFSVFVMRSMLYCESTLRRDTQLVTLSVRLDIVLTCNYHAITTTTVPFTFPISLSRLIHNLTVYTSNMACQLELLTLRKHQSSHSFYLMGTVLLISLVCVVLLCVFTNCDFCYNFCIKTMFGSSLTPVVWRLIILFTLLVFVCA